MMDCPDDPAGAGPAAGLYLHIPFCLRKCRYCAFVSRTERSRQGELTAALLAEMALWADFPHPCDTLYIGGGTPTLLSAPELAALIAGARQRLRLSPHAEITLEANPGTVTLESLTRLRQAGVTRLSLGVQSFQDRRLAWLGRVHNAAQARQAIAWARQAGFDELSLDLIYGLPGQTLTQWREELNEALRFAPQHLSCYALTIEGDTPLGRAWRQGRLAMPGERLQAAFFETTRRCLERQGFEHYETANFARQTGAPASRHRSRHNQKYWRGVPYLGLGPGAHSFQAPRRWWNLTDLDRYLAAIAAGRRPVAGEESLTRQQRMLEAIYLGLRQRDGIDLRRFEQVFGVAFTACFGPLLAELESAGYLRRDDRCCALAPGARVLLDTIAARFGQLMAAAPRRC